MARSLERNAGVAWWRSIVVYAGSALACALCSATPADAYCVYVASVEAQSISVIDTSTNAPPQLPGTIRYSGAGGPAGYSNDSLQGAWIFEALELPGYYYIVFDGQGGVTDLGAFCFQSGTYQVQADGALSATVASPQNEFCDSGVSTVYGTLTSPTTGTLTLSEGVAQMRKVGDLSTCQGNWEGVLTEVDTQQDHAIAFSVRSDGSVTSFTGFPPPVTGRMFADGGSLAGFLRASTVAPYFDVKILGTLSGNSATGAYVAEVPGHEENAHGEFVLNRRLPVPCVGDCGGDNVVTVAELLTMVNIALGNADVCDAGDANHDNQITVDEILMAVNNALNDCPQMPTVHSIAAAAAEFDPSPIAVRVWRQWLVMHR